MNSDYVDPTRHLALASNVPKIAALNPVAGFAGPFGVGKDHAIEAAGYASKSRIAGPLYELVEILTRQRVDKAAPGWRDTLCKVGAWGRGEISEDYPMTAERAQFIHYVRKLAGYEDFGRAASFWLDRSIELAKFQVGTHGSTAFPDVRYPNEMEAVLAAGWPVYFVACRQETLFKRRTAMGYPINSTERSERLANDLFARVVLSKLRPEIEGVTVLWSDEPDSCPPFAIPMFTK